ncbi:MAG: DUF4346 domain-containing protein, partial [Cyanobacteria bacterium P01_H01_bin.15]
MTQLLEPLKALDDRYSNRFIALDPAGYFIIYVEQSEQLICAKHFSNVINAKGLAVDPETGEVLCGKNQRVRASEVIYRGRTAKELCIKIFEEPDICPVTKLDHAAYLGREFVR